MVRTWVWYKPCPYPPCPSVGSGCCRETPPALLRCCLVPVTSEPRFPAWLDDGSACLAVCGDLVVLWAELWLCGVVSCPVLMCALLPPPLRLSFPSPPLPTVLQVHGAGRVQRLRKQLHQRHVHHQEGLSHQAVFPGVPQGGLGALTRAWAGGAQEGGPDTHPSSLAPPVFHPEEGEKELRDVRQLGVLELCRGTPVEQEDELWEPLDGLPL